MSLVLGNWLAKRGVTEVKVVLAENEDGDTHSWLVANNCIIDITADQFAHHGYGVFPLESEYHASYSDREEDSLDIDGPLVDAFDKFTDFMTATTDAKN